MRASPPFDVDRIDNVEHLEALLSEPTPQAIPNIVRNERSLCAQRLRKICAKMSKTVRIIEIHCTFERLQE